MSRNPRSPLKGRSQNRSRLARSLYAGHVAGWLRERIIDGTFPADEPMIEMRLAETLEVSRGPIRSALQALAAEGLVQTLANGRSVSAGFSAADADDLSRVRYELEATAIAWAVERDADFGRLSEAMEAIEAEGPDSPDWVQIDLDFHRALVAASGSRFLTQAWLAIAPVVEAAITVGNQRVTSQNTVESAASITAAHRTLYEAIVAKQTDEACRLLGEQFRLTESMVTRGTVEPDVRARRSR